MIGDLLIQIELVTEDSPYENLDSKLIFTSSTFVDSTECCLTIILAMKGRSILLLLQIRYYSVSFPNYSHYLIFMIHLHAIVK